MGNPARSSTGMIEIPVMPISESGHAS